MDPTDPDPDPEHWFCRYIGAAIVPVVPEFLVILAFLIILAFLVVLTFLVVPAFSSVWLSGRSSLPVVLTLQWVLQ